MKISGQIQNIAQSNRSSVVSILDLYLRHGADPSVCFIGYYYQEISDEDQDSSEQDQEVSSLEQHDIPIFYYTDLLTILKIWGLNVPDKVQKLLYQQSSNEGGVLTWLRKSLQNSKQQTDQIQRLAWDGVAGLNFVTIKVMPRETIKSIKTSELETIWKDTRGASANYTEDLLSRIFILV